MKALAAMEAGREAEGREEVMVAAVMEEVMVTAEAARAEARAEAREVV